MNVRSLYLTGFVVLLVAGCGKSAVEDIAPPNPEATTVAAKTPLETIVSKPQEDLPEMGKALPYRLQIRRTGSGENVPMEVLGATAVMENELRSYKIFLADYELDEETSVYELATSIPEGKTMVSIGLQTDYGLDTPSIDEWKKLKAGDVAIGITDSRSSLNGAKPNGEPISTVWIRGKDGKFERTSGRKTSMKVLYVSDQWVCLEANLTSTSGSQLSGIITAKVRR
ncbi:MAG: hypothetical protein AAGJ83_00900 [Planctomycetota bacterium]